MIVQSHLSVASMIANELKKHGLLLNKKNFMFGSIKPDISSMLKKHPHKINHSLDFIMQRTFALFSQDVLEDIKEFSYQLGIICHYITDFFTFAHNSFFQGPFSEHLAYERSLNNYVKRIAKSDDRTSIMYNISDSIEAFKDYLKNMHSVYMEKAVSFERDFSYAISLCMSFCLTVRAIMLGAVESTAPAQYSIV